MARAPGSGRPSNPRVLALDHLIGVELDEVLAVRAGVAPYVIAYRRKQLGRKKPRVVHTDPLQAARALLVVRNKSKLAPFLHLIGTMPDRAVAKLADVSRQAVQKMRTRFDLPTFEPAPVTPPADDTTTPEAPSVTP